MDRPVRPDPAEFPRIKRAMRAARFMKWGATPITGVAMIASIIVGASSAWYVGVLTLVIPCGALYLLGYSLARCPHCGQVWWGRVYLPAPWWPNWSGAPGSMPQED